jgi:hypothetical protein
MSDNYEKVGSIATKKSKSKSTKKSEEASGVNVVRANRRQTHKQTAHVPGPRRKPTLDPTVSQWNAEEETVAEAPAEAKVSDEGDAFE